MKSILFVSIFLIAFSSISAKCDESKLVLMHAGVFLADQSDVEITNDVNSTSGLLTTSDPAIVCETKNIPMKLGVSFGIYYKIKGYSKDQADIPVTVETSHPEIVTYTGEKSTLDVWNSDTSHYSIDGHVGGALFTFEIENELKLGNWSITVKVDGEEIRQEFFVSEQNKLDISSCHVI
jgi:hypothetical protein